MRREVYEDASPARAEQLRRAELSRHVYRAWNQVCAGTREGRHVTGLRYLPETNELLVYLDEPSWTQEMTMLREIIRARMDRLGVKLDGFKFRTSREEYANRAAASRNSDGEIVVAGRRVVVPSERRAARTPSARHVLSSAEEKMVEESAASIDDADLARSLKEAMRASLENPPSPSGGDA